MQLGIIKLVEDVLSCTSEDLIFYIKKAEKLTLEYFGKKRIFFNPIYLSNICNEDCVYCGYRKSNNRIKRISLNPEESVLEAEFLNKRGINNILLLAGEYNKSEYLQMIYDNTKAIIKSVSPAWLGLEIAALDSDDYKKLYEIGIDSVILFQETYDRNRYKVLHKDCGLKSDFDYRYSALSRVLESGIHEVGLGVLYGVGDWYNDTISMIKHANELKEQNSDVKLRFSFPRLMKSEFQSPNAQSENVTSDMLYRSIIAIRLAFPDASLILTGRENTDFLIKCCSIINILGKAGNTATGGYVTHNSENNLQQFDLNEDIPFNKFIKKLLENGYYVDFELEE